MQNIKNASFSILIAFSLLGIGWYANEVKSPAEAKFDYKYVPFSGECEKVGYLGNNCFLITIEVM